MKNEQLKYTNIGKSGLRLRSVLFSASCLIMVCFFLASSSIGQSVGVAQSGMTTDQSIISLAPSAKLTPETVARKITDSKFEHAPTNSHVFPAASTGEVVSSEVLTLNFAGQTTLSQIKSTNKDFVIEPGGTCAERMSYVRGDSCSLVVRFNPQGPGHRLGFLKIAHSAATAPATFALVGNGYAPVISFRPAVITTVPGSVTSGTGTIQGATSVAVDGGDVLYVADTGNNRVKELDSSGTIITPPLAPIATPASLAVDSFGIIYTANTAGSTYYFSIFYPWGSQTAYGYTYTPGACTPSTPCAFSAVGMRSPGYMSMDLYDDLFFEEGTKGAAEMPVTSVSGGSGSLNLWYLSDQFAYSSGKPASFAVDANGNLYTNYTFSTSTCYLLEEPLYNAEYAPTANRVAGGVSCGFSGDGGKGRGAEISTSIGQMAFDVAGNLYFADAGNQRVRRIDAATGIINTIAGNGTSGYTGDGGPATSATLATPTGVGVDSQGQVYIISSAPAAGPQQAIRKVGPNGARGFATTTVGSSSPAQTITVSNTGNATLTFTQAGLMTGGNASDFLIDSTNTTCVFTSGNQLVAGQSCQIGVIFKPSAVGTRTTTLKLFDNTVTNFNYVNLKGTGVAAAVVKITAPSANTQVTAKTASTFTVSVTSTRAGQPTGTVTFKADGEKIGSPVALSAGSASIKLGTLTTGVHTLSATYNGDAKHAAATASETITVQ